MMGQESYTRVGMGENESIAILKESKKIEKVRESYRYSEGVQLSLHVYIMP